MSLLMRNRRMGMESGESDLGWMVMKRTLEFCRTYPNE